MAPTPFRPHYADRYRELIPNPQVIELKGIDIFLIEAPEAVLQHIRFSKVVFLYSTRC